MTARASMIKAFRFFEKTRGRFAWSMDALECALEEVQECGPFSANTDQDVIELTKIAHRHYEEWFWGKGESASTM